MPTDLRADMAPGAEIHSLDVVRKRRYNIDLANANWHWQQTVASFALKGIETTDDDTERAGRMIAGDATIGQINEELRTLHTRA